MAHRFLALLLAIVLIGAGFVWPEGARAMASADVENTIGGAPAQPAASCDADDCHDDGYASSFADALQDAVALPQIAAAAPACAMTMARPRTPVSVAHRAPFLEGPQRPPCAATIA